MCNLSSYLQEKVVRNYEPASESLHTVAIWYYGRNIVLRKVCILRDTLGEDIESSSFRNLNYCAKIRPDWSFRQLTTLLSHIHKRTTPNDMLTLSLLFSK